MKYFLSTLNIQNNRSLKVLKRFQPEEIVKSIIKFVYINLDGAERIPIDGKTVVNQHIVIWPLIVVYEDLTCWLKKI